MAERSPIRVKIASERSEFDQIHQLNHRTFAEEIPQHAATRSGELVDRFHDENTYVIGLDGPRVAAMLAIRGRRPFSLDLKLPDLDRYLPSGRTCCELRLLAVRPEYRAGVLLPAVLAHAWTHIQQSGFDLAVISAIVGQLRLYRHLGFEPFGPLVGTPPACFQPMMLTREAFAVRAPALFRRSTPAEPAGGNFLPGPVAVHAEVRRAFAAPARSHRSPAMAEDVAGIQSLLTALTGARHAAVLLGSGTMANDVVAAQLARAGTPGVILTNGEFGERLAGHARRWRLDVTVIARPWGHAFDLAALRRALVERPERRWVWCAHVETSTGVLNDVAAIEAACRPLGVDVVLDAISAVGTVPVDFRGVRFATAVSGKALGAYTGLGIVLYNHVVHPAPAELPAVLDLGLHAGMGTIPFTQSSNLVQALGVALARVDWPRRYREMAEQAVWLRSRLRAAGFDLIDRGAMPAPGVVTVALAPSISSIQVADALERDGFLVSARSPYLAARNWIQIALMGQTTPAALDTLVARLERIIRPAA
jgi:aspartate aminotransferase-like enzyme